MGWEKVACWSTKSAISLKRVKIEEKLLYRGPIGIHQRSFERYHLRPPTASFSPTLVVRNPHPKLQSLLSQERVKLRTSTFVCTFIGSIGTNTVKNFRKSRFGRTQELRKIFRAPMYRAHRAVIFAVAQSSCNYTASRGKKARRSFSATLYVRANFTRMQ